VLAAVRSEVQRLDPRHADDDRVGRGVVQVEQRHRDVREPVAHPRLVRLGGARRHHRAGEVHAHGEPLTGARAPAREVLVDSAEVDLVAVEADLLAHRLVVAERGRVVGQGTRDHGPGGRAKPARDGVVARGALQLEHPGRGGLRDGRRRRVELDLEVRPARLPERSHGGRTMVAHGPALRKGP
jgi:hypothetical protein